MADDRRRGGRGRLAVLALALAVLGGGRPHAQELPDLSTPDVLRVCADPADMPFSNRKGEGFENKIAGIIAAALNVKLRYYWLEQGPGFVRNTLDAKLCDVIIGYATGTDLVLHTNPYYRSVYALLSRRGELAGLTRLDDPRLKGKRIGIIAGAPAGDHLVAAGLIEHVTTSPPYMLGGPERRSPAAAMVADLAGAKIDVAILWGPAAGWLARQSGRELDLVPLLQESQRPPLTFRIAAAVRPSEQTWKRTLNRVLSQHKGEIMQVLRDYAVPLVDENEELIPPEEGSSKP